jgi:HrpA-like RNA helicase
MPKPQKCNVNEAALKALPLFSEKDRLLERLFDQRILLLAASAGSGKTTGLPVWAYLSNKLSGLIIVVVPQRVLAIQAATRMSHLLGSPLGQLVGYCVRGERRRSKRNRILVVTEGVFLAMLLDNPLLPSVSMVLLDEVHLRTLAGDFDHALQRLAKEDLPHLHVVVTSATISDEFAGKLENYWGTQLQRCNVGGANVDIRYVGHRSLSEQVCRVIDSGEFAPCSILCFLPGEREIKAAREQLSQRLPAGVEIALFYGSQDATARRHVFEPAKGWRVILATNGAELGLTPAADIVVDTGTVKIPRFNMQTGARLLSVEPCSRQSADHRAWRVGRGQKRGVCFRLWNEFEHAMRPDERSPDIRRMPLEGVLLQLYSHGLTMDLSELKLLDNPDQERVEAAQLTLRKLGAINHDRSLTPLGVEMSTMPRELHPRLSRIFIAAKSKGCSSVVKALVALQSTDRSLFGYHLDETSEWSRANDGSDLLPHLRAFIAIRKEHKLALSSQISQNEGKEARERRAREAVESFCHKHSLVAATYFHALEIIKELPSPQPTQAQEKVTLSMVAAAYATGFPDRILMRSPDKPDDWKTLAGEKVRLGRNSVVLKHLRNKPEIRYLLANYLEEKGATGGFERTLIAPELTILQEPHLQFILGDLLKIERLAYRMSPANDCVIQDEIWLVDDHMINRKRGVPAPFNDNETCRILAQAIAERSLVLPGSEKIWTSLTILQDWFLRTAGKIATPKQALLAKHIARHISAATNMEEVAGLISQLEFSWETLSQLTGVPDLEQQVRQAKQDYPDQLELQGNVMPVTYSQDRITVQIDQDKLGLIDLLTVAHKPTAWSWRIVELRCQVNGNGNMSFAWTKQGLRSLRQRYAALTHSWSHSGIITTCEDVLRKITISHPDGEEDSFWMTANSPLIHANRQAAALLLEEPVRNQLWQSNPPDEPARLIIPEPTAAGTNLPPITTHPLGLSPVTNEMVHAYGGLALDPTGTFIVFRWSVSEKQAEASLLAAQNHFNNLCRNLPAPSTTTSELTAVQERIKELYTRFASIIAPGPLADRELANQLHELRWQVPSDQPDWLMRAQETIEKVTGNW